MDNIRLRVTLNESDWDAYLLEASQRAQADPTVRFQRMLLHLPKVYYLALIAVTAILFVTGPYGRLGLAALAAVTIFIWMLRLVSVTRPKPLKGGIFLGPGELELDRSGLRVRKDTSQSFTAWTECTEVSDTPTHIYVWVDRFTAHVIPLRELPPGLTAPEFVTAVRGFIANRMPASTATDPNGAELEAVSTGPLESPTGMLPGILTELSQLFRLFLLTDARPALLHGRDGTIALLGMLALGAIVFFERLRMGGAAEFFPFALASLAWFVAIALALAWVLARVSGLAFRRVLLLVAAVAFVAALAFGIGAQFGPPGIIGAYAIVTVEVFVMLGRGMTLLAGQPRRLAFAAGALLLATSWYLNDRLFLTPSFWMSADEDAESGIRAWTEREDLAYGQALRVDAALKSLTRQDVPAAQMFFLGFAGYGDERVFAEEISMAAARVDDRYGTAGRSLQLVNDRRAREAHPWATVSALRHTLEGMARVMDVERDVLFLALSSHGSEDATLSVNDGMPLTRDLTARELAEMLRESGIRWKVIVISACHAGSFLDELGDEHTIVLTAAAKDRTSFGCSDERDLTYFGEAFYRDALPAAPDLRSAFEAARAALAKREGAEGMRASDPQAHFGAQMERKLAELEAGETS